MLVANLPIVEQWSRAGDISMTTKSGLRGDFAAESMMSRGLRNFSIEGIRLFLSFSLKHEYSAPSKAIFGGCGCGKEGGGSLPDTKSPKTS